MVSWMTARWCWCTASVEEPRTGAPLPCRASATPKWLVTKRQARLWRSWCRHWDEFVQLRWSHNNCTWRHQTEALGSPRYWRECRARWPYLLEGLQHRESRWPCCCRECDGYCLQPLAASWGRACRSWIYPKEPQGYWQRCRVGWPRHRWGVPASACRSTRIYSWLNQILFAGPLLQQRFQE